MSTIIFLSLAKKDRRHCEGLTRHLAFLRDRTNLELWHRGGLLPGEDEELVARSKLNAATLVLLLISADYFECSACNSEMRAAFERSTREGITVIPILLKECNLPDSIKAKAMLPSNRSPILSGKDREKAWTDVADGIARVLSEDKGPVASRASGALKPDADPRMTPQGAISERDQLSLKAASRGTPGLIDELDQLCGNVLAGIYRIDSLANMGSQFAVFRGTNLEQKEPVAIKLPFVDYTRPASFGRQEVEQARSAALREWQSLLRHRARVPTLPWPYELVRAPNPLLAGRGPDPIWNQEFYLVEEWIDGVTFDEIRQQLFSSTPSGDQISAVVLPLITSLLSALARFEPELFADVSPRNFIWCKGTKTTRLVDAGNLVTPGTPLWVPDPSGSDGASRITTAVTLPYLSARDINAYHRGESRGVQCPGVIFAIGKMFHELTTNLHPLNGQDPPLGGEPYILLPRELRAAIDALLSGAFGSMSAARSSIVDRGGGSRG